MAEAQNSESRFNEESRSSKDVITTSGSSHLLRQTLTSLAPIMATIGIGATFGYSAVLLPQLKAPSTNDSRASVSWFKNGTGRDSWNDDNDIRLTSVEEESWVAASAVILMAPGCWVSGYLMENIGRKRTQMVIGPLYGAAWLAVGFSPGLWALITARVLSGLCIGLQSPLGPVYVAETTEPRLRGVLLAVISLAIAVGISISHVLGTWLSWRVAAHILAVFPALCFALGIFGKESPAWLLNNERKPEALEAWVYLRGNETAAEFRSLVESTELKKNSSSKTSFYSSLKSRAFLRPLFIINIFFFTAQFSGVNTVAFYCVQMIADVSGPSNPKNAHYVTLVLDAIRVAASIVACFLTRRYPRRILTLISGAGSAFSLLILSVGLVLDLGRTWLPALLLFAYTCLVSIGLVPLPWLLCGEIFPTDLRGLGSGLSSGFAFICFFIVVKTGPGMMLGLGNAATFLFYGTVTSVGTVLLYFFLPETKDKTLREIEENFDKAKTKEELKSGIDNQGFTR